MPITFENLPRDYEQLQVPVYILKGHSTKSNSGIIGAFSDKFPVQFYEVTEGYFKAYIHLSPGSNTITLKHLDGAFQSNGYAAYNTDTKPFDEITVTINYSSMSSYNDFTIPKIHLCVLVAKDSPALFDCPKDKLYEGNGLETAIRKLRCGGRIMQAFTIDEMNKNGCGKRCFQFVEEKTLSTISFQEETKGIERSEIKIHVIKTDRTTKEIRDANFAQQNPNAKKSGELFDITLKALTQSGGVFSDNATNQVPVMAAVIILDAHWDKSQNLILGHAALGGGTDRIKLAIFGSQGLHSWPMNWESIHKTFTDCTKLNTDEVANDCNECSQYWECTTVSLGAFMHEIGHSLGCPHQEHGVMLRDYTTMNRKFLTTEKSCVRTHKNEWGPVLSKDEPGWHRLDIMRFLYHPAFTLPLDLSDKQFKPEACLLNQGMKLPDNIDAGPNFSAFDETNLDIQSETGVYLIECHVGEWSRVQYEYIPNFYNGIGPQKVVRLNYDIIQDQIAPQFRNKPIKLEVLTMGFGQRSIDNLQEYLQKHSQGVKLSNGAFAKMSDTFGLQSGKDVKTLFPNKHIKLIRVTHGLALDGFDVFFDDMSKATFGNSKSHYSEFFLDSDEFLIGVIVRSGAWVDGIQFITNKKISPNFGGNGGSLHKFMLPQGRQVIGFYGVMGNWVNQVGVLYA